MKRITILTLFLLLVSNINLYSQELKPSATQYYRNSIIFSGIATHFEASGERSRNPQFYKYPIDPGVELLFQHRFSRVISLSTGVYYQRGRITTLKQGADRFKFEEAGLSFLINAILNPEKKNHFYASVGAYPGLLTGFTWDYMGSGHHWYEMFDIESEEHYSNEKFILDIYLNSGFSYVFNQRNEISITAFIKYRAMDNWMEYYKEKISYGIKLSYQLNFK
jgi:hypothetical protein